MYASVVVNVSSSNVDQYFEYFVPSYIEGFIKIGSRVHVSFGQGDRAVMGYVMDLYEKRRFTGDIKPITELLDLKPIITSEQLKLAEFLKEDTICPLIRILNLFVPKALVLKTTKYLKVNNLVELDAQLAPFFSDNAIIEYNTSLKPFANRISQEVKKGNLEYCYSLTPTSKFKYVDKFSVNKNNFYQFVDSLRSIKKKDFLREFLDHEPLTKNEIMDKFNVSVYMINDLVNKGFLDKTRVKASRIKDRTVSVDVSDKINEKIDLQFNDSTKPYLYIPKDKDENYDTLISLTAKCISNNQTAVIMVPEVLSSFLYASILRKSLHVDVACLNSLLSEGEHLDYYMDILDNKYQVIVTTAQCSLLPYQNVGLYYLVDEESDNYFNDQAPRYDLHRVYHYLMRKNHAITVMESFSPSVKSYCYALKGNYIIVDNASERNDANVICVNLLDEVKQGNNSYISKELMQTIYNNKKHNLSTILVVNNKNYSSYVMCRNCGYVEKCPKCGLTLQYDSKNHVLRCPACGTYLKSDDKCHRCGSDDLDYGGVGILKIEENLKELLPNYNIESLIDAKFKDYSIVLDELSDNEIDILITTSTYLKAIPKDNVGAIGIINFDTFLKNPSYDASSKAYDLLTRCAYSLPSEAKLIVQGTDINNPVLTNFIIGDYKGFMKQEIIARKAMYLEPFYHVNRIIVKAPYEDMFKDANTIKQIIITLSNRKAFVIGPTYSKEYRGAVLIIKHNDRTLNKVYKKIYENYQFTKTEVIFDKFPRSL